MRIPEKPNGRLVHTATVKPRWGHMDALGHINNTRYFAYCEQTRIEWMEKIGHISDLSGRGDIGPVVINAECTFLKQVVYPCTLMVQLYVGSPGRSSFMTWYEISDAESEVLYTTGRAKIVWIDYKAEKSVPLPDDMRELVSSKE